VLADDIALAKQREQIAEWDRREARLREQLGLDLPQRRLSAKETELWNRFSEYCERESVRKLPAKPHTVASYVLDAARMGIPPEQIFYVLESISVAHDYHGLSSPVHTAATREAIQKVGAPTDPPWGWRGEEKAAWAQLPDDAKAAVYRRESERNREMQRKHSEVAKLKRLLSGADKPAQTNSRKDYAHDEATQRI
jgi:hypothetical protein